MITSMSDLICVTNRKLCKEDFLLRIEKIAKQRHAAILFREKDLTEEEYALLAGKIAAICEKYGTPLIYHSFTDVALTLRAEAIHRPLPMLRRLTPEQKTAFQKIGASCHSVEDAIEAACLGCTYITVGHIFVTDCKKGLPGRGLDFLTQVVHSVSLPVYAIGGIRSENIKEIRKTGAAGACVMSGPMRCDDIQEYFQQFK